MSQPGSLSFPIAGVSERSTPAVGSDADEASPVDGEPRQVEYDGNGNKYEGSIDGAPYWIYVPIGWRPGGPLLMNMYGYWPTVMCDSPLSKEFGRYDPAASLWLDLGYAVAVSRSVYGWVPRRRMADTERLRNLFVDTIGAHIPCYPSVISGFSMGGMQTYDMIEKIETYPDYHGALALSGFGMPSLSYLQKYVFNTRLLFDFYFPGVLRGSVVDFPDGEYTLENVCKALRKYIPNGPANLFCKPTPTAAPERYLNPRNVEEYLRTTATPAVDQIPYKVALHTEVLRELHERHGDKNIFDNTNEIYPRHVANNRLIPRYTATARFDQEVEITGNVDKPVSALHTYVDEAVPVETTRHYMELTNQQGKAENFVQLYTNGSGHCALELLELQATLRLLDRWIRQGARPQPGDLQMATH